LYGYVEAATGVPRPQFGQRRADRLQRDPQSIFAALAPDIIEKVAWDPGWGHYEVLALQRFLVDNTLCVTAAPTSYVVGTASPKTTVGAGVRGDFLLPIIPNYLQLMGGVVYGRGIGRYGAGNLPDVDKI
jgi:hypothetical protein